MNVILQKTLLAGAAVAALGLGGVASANTVDLFSEPDASSLQSVSVNTVGGTAWNEWGPSALGSIIGGYRDVIVTMNSSAFPASTTNAHAGGGYFSFNNDTGVSGTARIQWDGHDNSPNLDYTGLGGLDLINQPGCGSGCEQFQAIVNWADHGFQYQIGVYTDASNYSILTTVVPFDVTSPLPATYDFAWFTLASGTYNMYTPVPFTITKVGSGPDFTNIGALEVVLNSDGGTMAVDLTIGPVTKQPIPEPATIALIGLALLGATATSRRRRESGR